MRRDGRVFRDESKPYEPKTEGQMVRARASKKRMIVGLSEIGGICRGFQMGVVDLGMARAACTREEWSAWIAKTESLVVELKTIKSNLMEVSTHGPE